MKTLSEYIQESFAPVKEEQHTVIVRVYDFSTISRKGSGFSINHMRSNLENNYTCYR